MRRLVYRNIFGNNPRKHEVSMEEISDRKKSRISRKIITKYFVKDRYVADDVEDIKLWIKLNKKYDDPSNCHILTTIDSKTGENKMVCKAMGTFYVVCELTVFKLVYINEIKVQMLDSKKVQK